jgi:hypothetical protein
MNKKVLFAFSLMSLSLFSISASAQSIGLQGSSSGQSRAGAQSKILALAEGDALEQVTSVSQLSDVQPTDWAYQALQSLVERYGCIAGYPNSTFRGNRAASRFEMAAALNACLDQISDRFATKEDLEAVRALQEEFKAELATLKGRVDSLEARTATLEAQQFSTTTKLSGKAVFIGQYGDITGDGFVTPQGNTINAGQGRANVLSMVKLDFNTSFNGSDLLQTSIAAGNNGQGLASELGGLTFRPDGATPAFASLGTNALSFYPNEVYLYRLAYTFKPNKDLSVTVGPKLYPNDFLDFNSYANSPFSDFTSYSFTNNPLIIPFSNNFLGGAGVGLDWKPNNGPFSVRATYVAASPNNSIANANGGGLFGDPYQASAEVEYAKSFGKDDVNNFAVRLQYTNSATFDVSQNAGGINVEATFGRFGIFGRYGISAAKAYGTAATPSEDFTAQTWMAGVGVKDLFVPGSLLAGSVGQPFINNLPPTATFGPSNATQTNIEAFYRFPVNDNISITPGVTVITNANNTAGQPTIIEGYVRTTFSF